MSERMGQQATDVLMQEGADDQSSRSGQQHTRLNSANIRSKSYVLCAFCTSSIKKRRYAKQYQCFMLRSWPGSLIKRCVAASAVAKSAPVTPTGPLCQKERGGAGDASYHHQRSARLKFAPLPPAGIST